MASELAMLPPLTDPSDDTVLNIPISPPQNSKAEKMICTFSCLLVCCMVDSGVCIDCDATGAPHRGHAAAEDDT